MQYFGEMFLYLTSRILFLCLTNRIIESTDFEPLLTWGMFSFADEQRLKCRTYSNKKAKEHSWTEENYITEENNTVLYLQNTAMAIYEYISRPTVVTQWAKKAGTISRTLFNLNEH